LIPAGQRNDRRSTRIGVKSGPDGHADASRRDILPAADVEAALRSISYAAMVLDLGHLTKMVAYQIDNVGSYPRGIIRSGMFPLQILCLKAAQQQISRGLSIYDR
jgi:hypothetical protein